MIPAAADPSVPKVDVTHPGIAAVDTTRFWHAYGQAAPPLVRFGVRASTWALTWAPPLTIGKLALLHHLPQPERDRVLDRLAQSRWYPVRQMVVTIKAMACFAYLHSPEVRTLFESES